ncbi:MAG: hypothetical protein WEA58_05255 [Balneolaceae bacterium]
MNTRQKRTNSKFMTDLQPNNNLLSKCDRMTTENGNNVIDGTEVAVVATVLRRKS